MEWTMLLALGIFLTIYVLMLAFQKVRPYIALGGAVIFMILGTCGVFDFGFLKALTSVDYNILLMIAGTMGVVSLFIESKMPALLAEYLISKVPNVKWAVAVLALFAGIISAFVDNVATVLMIAPIGMAIAKRLKISPVPVLIAIAVSSNLQGAATLVGDTTSMMLSGAADMNFLDFFWMDGKLGIFWGVQLGAILSTAVLLFLFRKEKQPIDAKVETKVTDYVPTVLLLVTVVLLMFASFLEAPANEALHALYNMRSGLICFFVAVVGIVYACIKKRGFSTLKMVWDEMDKDTLLLLFGLFMLIAGIESAGVIDKLADLFYTFGGGNLFLFYTLIVFASVVLSAFIDNIPYVATMLPVVSAVASLMGLTGGQENVLYFGLLIGATLGGNLTPIGASANITAIGILRKNGDEVKTSHFLKIGIPFTLVAVLSGYAFIWLVWGV